jgi:hypothetical protein
VLVGFESQSLSLHLILCIRRHSITVRRVRSADSRFGSITFVAHDFGGRRCDFWHRILAPSVIPLEIWYFTRVKPTKIKAFSINPQDYPSNMSLWERESLAAEAVLAAERKAKNASLRKQSAPKKRQQSA